jgi:hypothetical protein
MPYCGDFYWEITFIYVVSNVGNAFSFLHVSLQVSLTGRFRSQSIYGVLQLVFPRGILVIGRISTRFIDYLSERSVNVYGGFSWNSCRITYL